MTEIGIERKTVGTESTRVFRMTVALLIAGVIDNDQAMAFQKRITDEFHRDVSDPKTEPAIFASYKQIENELRSLLDKTQS